MTALQLTHTRKFKTSSISIQITFQMQMFSRKSNRK